jgi:hypothetical protein
MSPYERDVYQQLEDAKRIIAYLITCDGKDHARIPLNAFIGVSNSDQIVVWQDPVKFEMVVAFRGAYIGEHGPEYFPMPGRPAAAPPAEDEIVDAELVDEPVAGFARGGVVTPEMVNQVLQRSWDAAHGQPVPSPPTFRHEPHPELPGVMRPVLDRPVRIDPATGAVEWDN